MSVLQQWTCGPTWCIVEPLPMQPVPTTVENSLQFSKRVVNITVWFWDKWVHCCIMLDHGCIALYRQELYKQDPKIIYNSQQFSLVSNCKSTNVWHMYGTSIAICNQETLQIWRGPAQSRLLARHLTHMPLLFTAGLKITITCSKGLCLHYAYTAE